VYAGEQTRRQWLLSGDSFSAQHPATLHFGLGKTSTVKAIKIRWPDGHITRLDNPRTGEYHVMSASTTGP